jgi:WD40 repeat protein
MNRISMKMTCCVICCLFLLDVVSVGQGKRLWVLHSSGELVEYDPATLAAKQTTKVPAEAAQSPPDISVNGLGQILFAPTAPQPLSEEDVSSPHQVWFWSGHVAASLDQGLKWESAATGSNQAVTELAPSPYLSADGAHLFWFANQQRRLQREELDLSVTTSWQAWRAEASGAGREDLATIKLPECACPSGTCEESCPQGQVWVPAGGIGKFFLMTQVVEGKTGTVYKASTRYQEENGKWTATPLSEPVQRVLDASSDGSVLVEAIPDTSCCGWSNQSNDQTLVLNLGSNNLGLNSSKKLVIFDELATYKNPDYDVSFYTSNAGLSPQLGYVGMTIAATAQANQAIQLSEQGQASPEESKQIRKALAELPAVEVKTLEDSPRRVAFLPHATFVGWISEKEMLIVEDHLLAAYNVGSGARRKSSVRVQDPASVFLR